MGHRADVARDNVAAVLAEVLAAENTFGKTFEVFDGDAPVAEAIRAL